MLPPELFVERWAAVSGQPLVVLEGKPLETGVGRIVVIAAQSDLFVTNSPGNDWAKRSTEFATLYTHLLLSEY